MFSNASNYVQGVDTVFFIILGISFFFLILITALMIFFAIRYNKKRHANAVQVKDNTALEVTWTVIPIILVLFMFYIGWVEFLPMRDVPKDAMPVKVIARMWSWTFEYEGGKQADTLVLPIHKPVKLNLTSTDVIHGVFIPSFRVKEDAVPGKENYTWFIPGEKGDYDLFCSLYCGLNHSYMHTIVRIVDQDEYEKWLAALPAVKKDETSLGFKILDQNGCFACHSTDGKKLVGPTFKGFYGSVAEVTTNGVNRKVTVDSVYLSTSILDPNKDVAAGYPPGIMKSYKGVISDRDIDQIKDYLKTLQ